MLPNVLYIDLTTGKYEVKDRSDLFEEYIGGLGVGMKLLMERPVADPLEPEAPIVFAIGPFNSAYPAATKTVALFRSPHTGNLGESYAGGRLAMAMMHAGYGAIVITGQAEQLSYIAIHDDQVVIRNAITLRGLGAFATGRVLREIEKGRGKRSIIRIGPAGENGVSYSCVNVDTYRHFGRLGLGAVFGSKHLKAIVVSGIGSYKFPDMQKYKDLYREIYHKATGTRAMMKYHDMGTAANVVPLSRLHGLPTKNLQQSSYEMANNLSGETLGQYYLTRKVSCIHCPVGCIHIATLRKQFAPEHEYESFLVSYDYEPIFALGTMLGMKNAEDLLHLIEKVERHGLDAMSTGVCLAWATEAYERNLISARDTMGITLSWGDSASYWRAVSNISARSNEFYDTLARGVMAAADKYGGREFALALSGNEMAGYHTGYGSLMGFMYGGRHSHLDNGGYSYDQKNLTADFDPSAIADKLYSEESYRCISNSLITCLFARSIYDLETISRGLDALGIRKSPEELKEIGNKIYGMRWKYKVDNGFDLDATPDIPDRFFETPTPTGILDREKAVSLKNEMAERIHRSMSA